jgi:hypothetical protein
LVTPAALLNSNEQSRGGEKNYPKIALERAIGEERLAIGSILLSKRRRDDVIPFEMRKVFPLRCELQENQGGNSWLISVHICVKRGRPMTPS